MDRRQNNGSVKVVSPRHCAATSVLRNIAASTAVLGRVTRTMSVAPLLSHNLKQKKEVQLPEPSSKTAVDVLPWTCMSEGK